MQFQICPKLLHDKLWQMWECRCGTVLLSHWKWLSCFELLLNDANEHLTKKQALFVFLFWLYVGANYFLSDRDGE